MDTPHARTVVSRRPAPTRNAAARHGPPDTVLRWLIWGPAAAIVFSATVAVGGLVLFLLPLAAVGYGVFALIAWLGPGREEV